MSDGFISLFREWWAVWALLCGTVFIITIGACHTVSSWVEDARTADDPNPEADLFVLFIVLENYQASNTSFTLTVDDTVVANGTITAYNFYSHLWYFETKDSGFGPDAIGTMRVTVSVSADHISETRTVLLREVTPDFSEEDLVILRFDLSLPGVVQ